MSDIFVCYSKADRAIATRLGQRLRDEGWSVFMDVQTHVGKRWHKEIEKELHAARAVVVLWSARSGDSDFVLEEAEYALKEHLTSRGPTPGSGDVLHAEAVVSSKPAQPAPVRVLAPGQTFRDRLKTGAEGPLMVVIPAGRFRMGSPGGRTGTSRPRRPAARGAHRCAVRDGRVRGDLRGLRALLRRHEARETREPTLGPGPEAGHQRLLGGRARLLCLAWRAVRAQLPAAQRDGVGIRLPGRKALGGKEPTGSVCGRYSPLAEPL